jgi:hypothetical protein
MVSSGKSALMLSFAGNLLVAGGCRKRKESAAARKLLPKDYEQIKTKIPSGGCIDKDR